MSEIIEREEGLFTRHGATRALCLVTVISGAGLLFVPLVMLVALTGQMDIVRALLSWPLIVAIVLWFVGWGASTILFWWRTCDRCRRRLFAEARSQVFRRSLKSHEYQGMVGGWVRSMAEPDRDYRAKTFLGSYRMGAILGMALRGRLRCQWCGHEDGVKPDYVVTSPQ